ncbi:hypothetical protein Tco_0920542 [Tanacetum coccineum]
MPPIGMGTGYRGIPKIEDYPLPYGLKMPSHVGSYDRKGDLDNYLHLFEGAIHMQKWLMPLACHMFTYTLKDSARIWWNSQKVGRIINYKDLKAKFRYTDDTLQILGLHEEHRISGFVHGLRTISLVEFLSTYLLTTYKGLMEKTYTWNKARKVAINETPNDHQESFDRFKKNYSWDNNKGKKNRDRFSPCRGSNHGLLSNLFKSPKEILATEKVAKTFEQPPRLPGSRWSHDMSKYCHFHEDHGHDTNQCLELRHQIKEAVRSGQLTHLVKGIKKGKGEILEHPTRSMRVDSKILLVGFSREHSWPPREVPLEITIGDSPFTRTEILNFVIVRSNSSHNLLLRRTAIQ